MGTDGILALPALGTVWLALYPDRRWPSFIDTVYCRGENEPCYPHSRSDTVTPMPAVPNTGKPITQLLYRWQQGDAAALEEVSPLVYQELHKLASRAMRRERKGHTLCTTALVNEAMLHLMGSKISWHDQQHFYRVAVRQMRRILVDHARARQRKKRGGDLSVEALDEGRLAATELDFDLLDIDTALSDLAEFDQRKHDMVELYYFAGLTMDETARLLELSGKTVQRELRLAEAWLHHALAPDDNAG